jgi:hypothetical protein
LVQRLEAPPVRPASAWAAKQAAVAPDRFYGHEGTIHQTDALSIEMDGGGQPVAVWFRCQMLPFEVTTVGTPRASEMRRAYTRESLPGLTGVVLRDQVPGEGGRP